MPSRPCQHPRCLAYVPMRHRYCPEHRSDARAERRERDRAYDRRREPWRKAFYNSKAWKLARAKRIESHPVCERCNRAWSKHVHHRIPLDRCTPEQRVSQDNLMAICPPCHNVLEAEIDDAAPRPAHAPGG